MSRIAFLTLVFARSQEVPPRRSIGGSVAPVFLHEIEPLDRDEQLVLAGVAELEEFLRCCRRRRSASGRRTCPDAVIDVDDEVADLEIAQVGEERLASRTRRRSGARRSSSKTSASA